MIEEILGALPDNQVYVTTRDKAQAVEIKAGDKSKGLVVVEYPKGGFSITHTDTGLALLSNIKNLAKAKELLAIALNTVDRQHLDTECSKTFRHYYKPSEEIPATN